MNEKLLIVLLFGALFLASADNQLLIPLLPTLSQELEVPVSRLGLLFSAYALAAATASLFLGPWTDRRGRLPFFRAGLLCLGILALLTTLVDAYWQLLLVRAGVGATAGLISTCSISLVGDAFSYERRGRVMGIVMGAYFASLTLGIPLSAWLADRAGWTTPFLVVGLAAGCLFLLALFPLPGGGQKSRGQGLANYRFILKRFECSSALFASFAVSGGTMAFLTYISPYLGRAFQLTAVEISSVFIIAGLAAFVASPLSGLLADAWTKRSVFLVFNSLLALLLVSLTLPGWGWSLWLLLFVISLTVAFRQTALQTLQSELVETSQRGSFFALRNTASQLGISSAVFVSGLVFESVGYWAVTFLAALLTVTASLVILMAVPEPASPETSTARM